jgi:hypothetical protein
VVRWRDPRCNRDGCLTNTDRDKQLSLPALLDQCLTAENISLTYLIETERKVLHFWGGSSNFDGMVWLTGGDMRYNVLDRNLRIIMNREKNYVAGGDGARALQAHAIGG